MLDIIGRLMLYDGLVCSSRQSVAHSEKSLFMSRLSSWLMMTIPPEKLTDERCFSVSQRT